VDAWFCDPLELLPESTLGVPGLVDACRAGTVTVANTLGSGVIENAGIDAHLPILARELLGEELSLRSVPTWWCGDPASMRHVISNMDRMVVRRTSRRDQGPGIDATRLDAASRAELAALIEHAPGSWVGQEWAPADTAPVLTPDGFKPRPTVLRTFAVADDDGYHVMTGGLARTARTDDPGPISNATGAIAKDTWVLTTRPESLGGFWLTGAPEETTDAVAPLPARAAENMFWLGRYAERAEATVRLIRVVNGRRTEFDQHSTSGPGDEVVRTLLEGLTRVTTTFPGFVGDHAAELIDRPEDELFSLIVDAARPGTVAQATPHPPAWALP
jgi:hypothetical protein